MQHIECNIPTFSARENQTNLSVREICRGVMAMNTLASRLTVRRMLRKPRVSCRKARGWRFGSRSIRWSASTQGRIELPGNFHRLGLQEANA